MMKSSRTIRSCSAFVILTVVLLVYVSNNNNNRHSPVLSRHRFARSANNTIANQSYVDDSKKSLKVWLASSISVFIISAVGLLGVAVVPLVQKVFFNKIIQYLVALAVGSLTGDAFLHLIPHAILGSHKEPEGGEKDENEERVAVMKGLAALGGVYFFFMAEKCLSMISDYRAEKRAEEEERQRQLQDPRRSELRRLSTMQLSAGSGTNRRGSHLPNSRDSAMFRRLSKAVGNEDEEDGILTIGLSSRAMKSIDNLIRFSELDADEDQLLINRKSLTTGGGGFLTVPGSAAYTVPNEEESEDPSGDIKLMVPSPGYVNVAKEEENKPDVNSGPHVTIVSNEDEKKMSVDGSISEKEDKKAGHGHGHGHSHEVPGSIAAVAWMVILGDGLHNFSDGLAIGAAFGVKISGGISTAVAVFCHELPHELGDFAVLLKTGMKVKEALFYNIVSSVLCFLGMIIGIGLQSVESASFWIFAITAGTFIYIALVDMLPELNSAEVRPGESRILHFCIQNLGLITGVVVMLLIALYEETIKVMLD